MLLIFIHDKMKTTDTLNITTSSALIKSQLCNANIELILYTKSGKNKMFFCNIFYKTWVILIKYGMWIPELIAAVLQNYINVSYLNWIMHCET